MKSFLILAIILLTFGQVCYSQSNLIGVVRTQKGQPIPGVEVSIPGEGSDISTGLGEFRIRLKTLLAGDKVALNLNKAGWEPVSLTDLYIILPRNYIQNPVYLTMRKVASEPRKKQLTNKKQTISPTGGNDSVFVKRTTKAPNTPVSKNKSNSVSVRGYIDSKIYINKGQRVVISASGLMFLGPTVKDSGPEGKSSLYGVLSLSGYNIIQGCSHGALIYKIGDNSTWACCGGSCEFIAGNAGYLIFNVNDNDPANNTGSYQTNVNVFNE